VIRAQAARGDYLTRETALAEVTSLEAGERLSCNDDSIDRAFFWNPCRISQSQAIPQFDAASGALRDETLRAIASWASRYRTVALQLSGGLDSSIVLAGLKAAPTAPRIYAVNWYSTECTADERSFAQTMATLARVPFVTIERDSDGALPMFLRCSRTARPVLNFTAPGHALAIGAVARTYACDAVFDGELGDNVFGTPYTAEPMVDFFARYGLRPQILTIARDLARVRRISLWRALSDGVALHRSAGWRSSRLALTRIIDASEQSLTSFVTRDALEEYRREEERFIHPWFQEEFAATPTAIPLIYALIVTTSTSYHAPFDVPEDPPYIRPLISLPLVEVALRIPGALSIRGGWNRAVARAAFSNELSKKVLLRTTKMNFDSWVRLAIHKNTQWLRDFLLDGILARERILDVKRVTMLLSEDLVEDRALMPQLFVAAYIEGWLRQWRPS
jgi:asparagine synthase (glutamine-hydrolysing)